MTLAIVIHLMAAIVWVGGMFFAAVVLRPATVRVLEAPDRLLLWVDVLKTFFLWVGISIVLLLATGYGMVFGGLGGFAGAPAYVETTAGFGRRDVEATVRVGVFSSMRSYGARPRVRGSRAFRHELQSSSREFRPATGGSQHRPTGCRVDTQQDTARAHWCPVSGECVGCDVAWRSVRDGINGADYSTTSG